MGRFCTFMFTFLLGLQSLQADLSSIPITTLNNDQDSVAIDGNVIVWSDTRNSGHNDIYCAVYPDPNLIEITTAANVQDNPSVSGNIIVWQDNRNGNLDIYGFDLSDPNAGDFVITNHSASQQDPAISGSVVVWRDNRHGNLDIYGFDLSNPGLGDFPIVTQSSTQVQPDIDGDIVIWLDTRNGNPDIYGYDLSTLTEFPIVTTTTGQFNPRISGAMVVWTEEPGGGEDSDIYGIDLNDLGSGPFVICNDQADQSFPAVDGSFVVWVDDRNEQTHDKDIYGYDLNAQVEFAVCLANSQQTLPDVSGTTFVWQSYHSDIDIILGEVVEPVDIEIITPNGSEMFLAASEIMIQWQQNSGEAVEKIKIEFSDDFGLSYSLIADNLDNNGSFLWDPIADIESQQCMIRVSDRTEPLNSDLTDSAFTIFRCQEELTADFNGDCGVDIIDFSIFSQQWFDCGNPFDPHWCGF